jgi:ribosomal protein S12 methylthiotransferase accessory factor YcaO
MKKYFFNPSWDIIPRDDFVECISHNETLRIPLSPTLCNALLRGASLGEISDQAALEKLKKAGVVVYKGTSKAPFKPTRDYLQLLRQHCIGYGKILSQVTTCLIEKTNPFYKTFHVSYSSGFAPQCIPHQSSLSGGWGADTNAKLASIKAIVEGVERYALANYTLADFEEKNGIHYKHLQEINGIGHVEVPLDSLHHPVNYTELNRMPVAPLNISGVAGHQSIEAALTNGALELCEHEALMVAWYGNRTTPTIIPESLDTTSQVHIRHAQELGWKIILKDISLDLVPVIMAIGLGPKGKRALTIGSCAAFTSKYAAKKALTEVIRTILVDEASQPVFPEINREEVNDIATHSYYYAHHAHLKDVSRLWQGGKRIPATDTLTHGNYENLETAIQTWENAGRPEIGEMHYIVKEVLGSHKIKTYWDNITPQEITKTNLPLVVVRVVAPEIAPLTVGFRQRPGMTDRFRYLLTAFGTSSDVQKELHPFS